MLRFLRFLAPLLVAPALFAEAPKQATALNFIRKEALAGSQSALQTLSAEYKPAAGDGPSVWLIGVAHLGTKEYYTALQKRLDAQGAVLFEGVGGEQMTAGAKAESGGIQGQLAAALGLVFQLDAIDYKRAHFSNSDLTPEALNQAIARRAEEPAAVESDPAKPSTPGKRAGTAPGRGAKDTKVSKETFDELMSALRGEGELAQSLGGMIALMGSTPQMRETTKLMLIEALGQAGEIIDIAKTASPEMKDLFDVIITERNAEVIRQLEARLKTLRAGQSIAVFYGAAHMDEIADRLTRQLHFKPVAQHWDTAFSADGTQSIMPPAQIQMMLQMVRAQMQNPGAGAPEIPFLNLFQPPKNEGRK